MNTRVTEPVKIPEEEPQEKTLRPARLDDFIGQERLKENLRISIEAALGRKEPLDHCLFYSPPGLGKTSMAYIIANEMGVNIRATSGPVLERAGDLAALLTSLSPGDVFFIDEIHRMNKTIEEILYPVMEDFKLDIIIGQGPSARSIKLDIPSFTLIGSTTRAGLLTSPLRERFGIVSTFNFYTEEELTRIVLRSAQILGAKITDDGAHEIAKRSRSTPRIANRLLKRTRDFAQVRGDGIINHGIADDALKMLEIDQYGLDDMDRRILKAIIQKFSGGPVGIETIAVAVGEEIDTITDVYEPFLIKSGFIARTLRGRVATKQAYQALSLPYDNPQGEFFSG